MMKKAALLLAALLAVSMLFAGCVPKAELDMDKFEESLQQNINIEPVVGQTLDAPQSETADEEETEDEAVQTDGEDASSLYFPWRSYTMRVEHGQDDGSVKNGSNTPSGKFINVSLHCEDGKLVWDDISSYSEFTLEDSDGNIYEAVGTGMTFQEGMQIALDKLEKSEFAGMAPIFDVPEDLTFDDLTLRVKGENEGETIIVPLAGLPKPENKDSL